MLIYDIGPAPPPPLYKGRALDPPRAPLSANLCNKIQVALQQLRFGVFGYGKNVPTRINQSSVIISHNLNSFYINKMHAINTTATIVMNQSYLRIKLANISENELLLCKCSSCLVQPALMVTTSWGQVTEVTQACKVKRTTDNDFMAAILNFL